MLPDKAMKPGVNWDHTQWCYGERGIENNILAAEYQLEPGSRIKSYWTLPRFLSCTWSGCPSLSCLAVNVRLGARTHV